MMRSLFSGVSGLKVHQTRMDNIGNNIANINTVGFKSTRTTFADMLSQTQAGAASPTANIGGTNPKQIGLGVSVASMDLIFTDGSPQSTGKNTDIALSGNGLFVVKNGDQTYYTRDGAFEFDADGYYVLPGSGLKVQGWNAVDGSLNTNSLPTDIIVPSGKTMEAARTTSISFVGNLDSNDKVITKINGQTDTTLSQSVKGTGDSVQLTFNNDTSAAITNVGTYRVGDTMPISTVIDVYDTLGDLHSIPVLIERVTYQSTVYEALGGASGGDTSLRIVNEILENQGLATHTDAGDIASDSRIANVWMITLADTGTYDNDTTDYTLTQISSSDKTKAQMAPIIIRFSDDGTTVESYYQNRPGIAAQIVASHTDTTVTRPFDTYEDDTDVTSIKLSLIYTAPDGAMNQTYMHHDGTGNIDTDDTLVRKTVNADTGQEEDYRISINFAGDQLTQYARGEKFVNDSNVHPSADGNAAGYLSSVSIDTVGVVTGTYTNGQRRFEAQVAVAQFTNPSGLTKTGNSMYQESNNSGSANVQTVSSLGLSITPSALEMSNVDLANEFSEMIITQRGFQANSKIINVGDEMLETLVNMKR
ncbi:MAG: flagellar hook-basal body complex protein [Selenomonadaceae bacterium]|nr:flagellar hook-basal body complex protein [Selenomonadaceae bacterium]